ncbi:MAG: HAD family hydrolase [Candidatus Hodarchaeales archaeon]
MIDPIELIIFDLDDTLVRSSINYAKIRTEIAELFPKDSQLPHLNRTPILKLIKQLRELDEDLFHQAKLIVEKSERNAVNKAIIMDGASVIPSLLKHYNIKGVIYTNNTRETVKLYLRKLGFEFLSSFEIFTRDDIQKPKPDPEGIIMILNRWSIPKLNTLYIGDSFIDSEAANNAKIKFILFNSRNMDPNNLKTIPLLTLNDWSEFEPFLQTTQNSLI